MARVRQSFTRPRVDDPVAAMTAQMRRLAPRIQAGATVGITAGSRGIQNICPMLQPPSPWCASAAQPPCCWPPWAATAAARPRGRKRFSTVWELPNKTWASSYYLRHLPQHQARLRTARGLYAGFGLFRGRHHPYKPRQDPHLLQGLCGKRHVQKLVVGLGGPGGAGQFHSLGQSQLPRLLVDVAKIILKKMPVIGGVAIVENAYEETALIEALPAEAMIEREVELLAWSKTLMPALPVDSLHGLVVEEMGKNFSGTGVDTNIIGRLRITGEAEPASPKIRYVSVLDLTEESHGNATGIGLVDFTTQKLVDKVDRKATYLNNLTTTFVTGPFCPRGMTRSRKPWKP